jgi:hypothetical protein
VKLKEVTNVSVTTRLMNRCDECSGNRVVLRRDGEKQFFSVTPYAGQQVMEEFLYFSPRHSSPLPRLMDRRRSSVIVG